MTTIQQNRVEMRESALRKLYGVTDNVLVILEVN
jgi:hypothetical protein